MAVADEQKRWSRWLILAAAWALALLYAYPGMMSTDSVVQLLQARGREVIGDGNPPVMAMMWRGADWLISGAFGMLLLQTGTFLFGLDAILRRVLPSRAAALAAGTILLLPPVLAPMGVIWKDSQMAGLLVAGIAMLLSSRRPLRLLGCLLLVLATALRYNAAAATLPVVVLLFQWGWQGWRRYMLATTVWLAITCSAFAMTFALAEREDHLWHSSLALMDVVGTIYYADAWDTDAELVEVLDGTPLVTRHGIRERCRHAYWPALYATVSAGTHPIFEPPDTEAEREAVEDAWWRVLTEEPLAYLRHRWEVFGEVLAAGTAEPLAPVWSRFVELPSQAALINVSTRHSGFQKAWLRAHRWLASTFVFRPRFYLLLALVLAWFVRDRLVLSILASGVLYEASLFVVAPSSDFRYSHWLIVCTLVTTVMLVAIRRRTLIDASSTR